jgi:hypothetical protein
VGASVPATRQDVRLPPNPFLEPGPIEREDKAAAGTIRIILENVNRHGRSSASLPDGTILVGSSRQPFLDAARVLIASGYEPDSWLERDGSSLNRFGIPKSEGF